MYVQEKACEPVPHSFLFRTAKQHRGTSKLAFSVNHATRQAAAGLSSGLQGSASLRPPVLDESLIREQTQVDHFWGESATVWSLLIVLEEGMLWPAEPSKAEGSSSPCDCAAGPLSSSSSSSSAGCRRCSVPSVAAALGCSWLSAAGWASTSESLHPVWTQ